MEFIAHIRESDGEIQTVAEHLLGVQDLAEGFGGKLKVKHIAGLAGLLHDLGKYTEKFRTYIRSAVENPDDPPKRGSVDHSTAGGKLLFDLFHQSRNKYKVVLAEIVGNAIISHHAYLHDFISPDLESKYLNRVGNEKLEGYEEAVGHFFAKVMGKEQFAHYVDQAAKELEAYIAKEPAVSIEHKSMLLTKFVFSALIDADRTNTRLFEDNKREEELIDSKVLFDEYYGKLMDEIGSLQKKMDADSPINRLRQAMSDQCEQFAEAKPSGIYTLSIPTGGGKTLASLRYALKHAEIVGKKRIIYVVPYTTIIEQNAGEVRSILQDEANILEHHSNVAVQETMNDELEDGIINIRQKLKLAKDNWDSPIIFTTMVQFLNVFYAVGSRNIRRLHNLSESVLIFDEVQKVPVRCVSLFNQAVNFLKTYGNSSIVLCTATQPELDYVRHKLEIEPDAEIVDGLKNVVEAFRRVEIVDRATDERFNTDKLADFVLEKLDEARSMLVILNTKGVVNALYRKLKEEGLSVPLYHLSTSMCPAHRQVILKEVRTRLEKKEPVVCISTQLIEAGVDVSFRCVVRSLAGLDSIAQAAGRCNRHGEDTIRQVYVIDHEEENLRSLKEIREGKEISRNLLIDLKRDRTAHGGHLLSVEAMEIYFRIFYTKLAAELNYPISKLEKNMTELLSETAGRNRKENYFWSYYAENDKHLPLVLTNSYRTAAEHFRVIDDLATTVIVPYGGGERVIAELNGRPSVPDLTRLLREAQPYTVNLYSFEKEALSRNKALISYLDGKVLALTEGAYHEEYGLNTGNDSELALQMY